MTRDTVTYEWAMQELDYYEGCDPTDPDILETWYADNVKEAMQIHFAHDGDSQVVLIRTIGNDDEGVLDRTEAIANFEGFLATAKGWTLPRKFEDRATKVPVIFHQQIRAYSRAFVKSKDRSSFFLPKNTCNA